jgi:uncharacterized protein YcbX
VSAANLASIHIYPMKAARAVDLGESRVEPWGLAGDRRWMLAGSDGRFVSQREEASLARVTVHPDGGALAVTAPGRAGLRVAVPAADGPLLKVSVWGSRVLAAAAGPLGGRLVLGLPGPAGEPGLPGRPGHPAPGRP